LGGSNQQQQQLLQQVRRGARVWIAAKPPPPRTSPHCGPIVLRVVVGLRRGGGRPAGRHPLALNS